MNESLIDRRFYWPDVDPDANLDHLLRFAYEEIVVELGRSSREPAGAPSFHLHVGGLEAVIATKVAPVRRRLAAGRAA